MISTGKKKPIVLNKAAIERIKNEATLEALVIFTACLMDEYDLDEEAISQFYERLDRYAAAINDHTLTIRKMAKIIREQTGLAIKW